MYKQFYIYIYLFSDTEACCAEYGPIGSRANTEFVGQTTRVIVLRHDMRRNQENVYAQVFPDATIMSTSSDGLWQ